MTTLKTNAKQHKAQVASIAIQLAEIHPMEHVLLGKSGNTLVYERGQYTLWTQDGCGKIPEAQLREIVGRELLKF